MKKSKFFAFILSAIPGCGLMYLGYMKRGIQIMIMFALTGYLSFIFSNSYMDWIMALFVIAMPVLWMYQLFDTMHTIARMKRLEIEVPEDDGFILFSGLVNFQFLKKRAVTKVLAIVLIAAGCMGVLYALLNNLSHFTNLTFINDLQYYVRRYLASVLVSFGLIIVGGKLLKGSKNTNEEESE